MNALDALEWAEEKGASDGCRCASFSPPLIPDMFPEEAEVYAIAYFYGLAYLSPWPGGSAR